MLRSTKKTSVENTLIFFFCKNPKSHPRGWIRTAAARRLRPAGQKSPSGAFLAARLAETPAPTKKTSVENTLVFFFYKNPKTHPRGWIRTAAARRLRPAGQKSPGGAFLAARLAKSTRAHQKSATPLVPDPLRHFASEMPPLPKGEALAVRKGLLAFVKISPHCSHTTAKVTAVCYIKKTTRFAGGFLYTTKQRRCKTVSAKCFIQRILGRCQKRLSPRSGSCRSSQRGQAGPHRTAWWGRYPPGSRPHAA